MEHTTNAVDLAESVFQIAVSRRPGRMDEERRLSRDRLLAPARMSSAAIGSEDCSMSTAWQPERSLRTLQSLGRWSKAARCVSSADRGVSGSGDKAPLTRP